MLVFEESGKPNYREKNLSEQGKNQQQTQPTYDAGSGNRTRDTLVRGERSHHCRCQPCSPNVARVLILVLASVSGLCLWFSSIHKNQHRKFYNAFLRAPQRFVKKKLSFLFHIYFVYLWTDICRPTHFQMVKLHNIICNLR